MKEPCVGYSPQALGAWRAISVSERPEIRKAFLLMYNKLQNRPKSGQSPPEELRWNVDYCVITYRRPVPRDRTVCCNRKVALWVIRIDGTDQ
jgi:hypothetical protein